MEAGRVHTPQLPRIDHVIGDGRQHDRQALGASPRTRSSRLAPGLGRGGRAAVTCKFAEWSGLAGRWIVISSSGMTRSLTLSTYRQSRQLSQMHGA